MKNLIDVENLLRNDSINELANVLKQIISGDREFSNTSYPTPILKLIQNVTKEINSSSGNKTLLAILKNNILTYKREHSGIDDLIFKGRDTKHAILGNKTKETIDGKKVVVKQIDTTKDVLELKDKRKLLKANIVLPDATNSNTHVVDTIQNPGNISKAII